MLTARVPVAMEQRLAFLSNVQHTSKSELIKEALEEFLYKQETEDDSLAIGEPYFGKYGSGDTDRSITYKQRIKDKLHAKRNSH
jgi:predicted DNA-binding protein